MSQRQAVRWTVPRGVPRRVVLLAHAPRLIRAALLAAILDRPAGSALRRRVLTDGVRLGMDLLNRRGERRALARVLRFYDPACEIHIGPGFALDAERIYRGHAGWRALLRLWDEAVALAFVAEEMLDMGGPCYALLVSVNLTGIESGASTPPVQAVWTYTLSRGLVVRQDVRHDGWDTAPAALAAALARVSPAAETPSPTPARGPERRSVARTRWLQALTGRRRGERVPGQMRNPVVTRVQHSRPARRSRNLEERLMVRFPAAWRTVAALVQRLFSPRSRLRRAMLRRAVISGWDAFSRLDLELMLVRYAPNVEYEFDPQFEALGIAGTFRGHDGMLELIEAFGEAWGQREVRPMVILDLDDRALILGTLRLPGIASGLEFESEYAQLLTPRDGLVAHQQDFLAWDMGLRAAGLEPQAFASRVRPGQGASGAG